MIFKTMNFVDFHKGVPLWKCLKTMPSCWVIILLVKHNWFNSTKVMILIAFVLSQRLGGVLVFWVYWKYWFAGYIGNIVFLDILDKLDFLALHDRIPPSTWPIAPSPIGERTGVPCANWTRAGPARRIEAEPSGRGQRCSGPALFSAKPGRRDRRRGRRVRIRLRLRRWVVFSF